MTKRTDFGQHYLIDFVDCDPEITQQVEPIREIVMRAAKECGATILNDLFHQFQPMGVSGVVVIAESHISVHTWPENGFVAIDIFTCGEMQPQVAVDIMRKDFRAKEATVKVLVRGQLERG
jgi:S-adenosylmethionine decarboxylase proenzyme